MGSDGNLNGTIWGGWLSSWLNTQFAARDSNINTRVTWDWINGQLAVRDNNINARATIVWVNQNFVQNIDLTAPTEIEFRDGWGYPRGTDGAAIYNFKMVGGSSNVGWFQIRYTRKCVNDTWYVIN